MSVNALRDRCARSQYDAVVVGAGPNGLAASITLAESGANVLLIEANADVGGACRSRPLTLPGFVHDVGSAIHPLAFGSPFFRTLPLDRFGLEWVHPDAPLAHPLDGGRRPDVLMLERSVKATSDGIGGADGEAYGRLLEPLFADDNAAIEAISELTLLRRLPTPDDLKALHIPALSKVAALAGRGARSTVRSLFTGSRARALFAGMSAHANMPLETMPSGGIALALAVAGHAFGWPFPRGGAQSFSNALADYFRSLGGEIVLNTPVTTLDELPTTNLTLCDLTPRQLLAIAGDRLPSDYRRGLERFRYGPSAFKVDWALDSPIPWHEAIAANCGRAATVHLGGTFSEIADGERAIARGQHPARPYVLLAQHTLFDPTRAPSGGHTAWAYCHVPFDSTDDQTAAIEAQIERFAPGFQKHILARAVHGPQALEAFDANLIGGDFSGGAMDGWQFLVRPLARANPYRTPIPGLYLCSASTPPGPGVHGMCGYWAARSAMMGANYTALDTEEARITPYRTTSPISTTSFA